MKATPAIGLLLLGACAFPGCSSTQVHWDATKLREHSNSYYENQIMDNLIRAMNGRVFVHVDLTALDASAVSGLGGESGVSGGQTLTNTNVLGEVVGVAVRSAERPFTFNFNPKAESSLNMNAQPALAAPEVYSAYIRFLNLRTSQDRLKTASEDPQQFQPQLTCSVLTKDERFPPASGEYIPGTLRKWDRRYYYVPRTFRAPFQELCLEVLQSGPETKEEKAARKAVEAAADPGGRKQDAIRKETLDVLKQIKGSLK